MGGLRELGPPIFILLTVQKRVTRKFSQITRKLLVKIVNRYFKVGWPTSGTYYN